MPELKIILEAVLLAAGEPLSLDRLLDVFPETERPEREVLRSALVKLAADYAAMAEMFMEGPPAFEELVSRLADIEARINAAS